jgi:5-formaminoimidazole-4-carboxamide-1-(beta)-D-ribofuranosyl 5'-monophosphate synthetase
MKKSTYTIATLGSHSSLQILKGAKDEGFATLLVTTSNRVDFYKQYSFIDTIIPVVSFAEFPKIESMLKKKNSIIIPHGSFVAYLGIEKNKKMQLPYFGNKKVLDFESDRNLQREWLVEAGITVPKHFKNAEDAAYPVIVKTFGAAGGAGYFYAKNKKEFNKKIGSFKKQHYTVQEYIVGVNVYIHYFYSPLTKKVEILSVDRRYETNVDGLGRLPLSAQEGLDINPSYVVVGNSPLVIRESLLPEVQKMGERIVAVSKKIINKKGMYGPFCLETIVTPDQKFYAVEISCRIVAGTNLFMNGSPYSWLLYNEPMSTGRRIAREIKLAIKKKRLREILD